MADRISGYADAIIALAGAEDALDVVESELATVAQAVEANPELRDRLSDRQLPVSRRLEFIETGALKAAHPATRGALAMLISIGHVSDLSAVAQQVRETAAASRGADVAEVTVAVPLDDHQQQALKRALEQQTGRSLELRVTVDPNVVGGVRARIGDTVIDGSLSKRLADVRTRIGA